jgi:hypothetical protein
LLSLILTRKAEIHVAASTKAFLRPYSLTSRIALVESVNWISHFLKSAIRKKALLSPIYSFAKRAIFTLSEIMKSR